MIYPKISSPNCTSQRKKRQTNSGRIILGSAKSIHQNEETISSELEEPIPIHYSNSYKQKKAQSEMGNMFKKKKTYPIAPDALIPNSTFRTIFNIKEIKPIEPKDFQLRLDILDNLQNNDKKNINWQDDDDEEWTELDDPDAPKKPTGAKKTKATIVSQQKSDNDDLFSNNIYWTEATIPDLFKRLQNESWWKQIKEDKPNLRSILLYLNEILKLKQNESYESACSYVIEIFRTYGIEPIFVNQILDILLDHLTKTENDQLDIYTIRTIAQFMIERKDIIIRLLEYALKCQTENDIFRLETINAIKFITDINNSDDINLVLENMSVVYNTPDDNFSLKMIIQGLENKKKPIVSDTNNEQGEETNEIHPLLKKISEERWFPRGHFTLTLDFVLDAIIKKLPDASKTMVKTLTTHFIQLYQGIGFVTEQFDRVSNALITLLSHTDADYRLIAATNLANLNKETKAIDIALLNSFLNDARILVRTECCDGLKKLTGIMSDTVLKDCADDMAYLQTLPEENFSLQNYLKEKNRLPTPPPSLTVDQPSILPVENQADEEEEEDDDDDDDDVVVDIPANEVDKSLTIDQIDFHEDIPSKIRSRSPSSLIIEQSTIVDTFPLPTQPESARYSATTSVSSSVTSIRPSIRVEINEKHSSVTSSVSKIQKEPTSVSIKQSTSPTKTPLPDYMNKKRSSILSTNTNIWDSYVKQNESMEENEKDEYYIPTLQSTVINNQQTHDSVQTILEEHKQTVGFYRMIPPRRILVPHKISMDNILADQSHLLVNPYSSPSSMNLSDLNHNQYQLNEVEFVQLLSSLVIRAIQVHRQYEKFLPVTNSSNFTHPLNFSPIQLHSSSNFQQSLIISSSKLPSIGHQQSISKQFTRMQSNIQAKAAREGINIHKAQNMENVFSNVLKTHREPTKSTMFSSSISHPSSSKQPETTHAWLLVQFLKSHGVFNSEGYLQKIIQAYPKFTPLLHTKIPQNLISIIWNDAIMKQLASIFSHKRDQSSVAHSSIKRSDTKQSVPTTDDDYSVNGFEYSTFINRDDQKRKYLPIIRGSKINLPRHVLKFGFRQIDTDATELTTTSPREEHRSTSRKRRVQMHLMMSANENIFDRRDSDKSPLRQMIKTDYQTTSYVPIVTRPPLCH